MDEPLLPETTPAITHAPIATTTGSGQATTGLTVGQAAANCRQSIA